VEVLEGDEGKVVGLRSVDLCLEISTKTIRCAMYKICKKAKYLS
jgi:hypothetical protein